MSSSTSRTPSGMQRVRDEMDRDLERAIDEMLRRDWGPSHVAEQAGEYAQILRDVVSTSMLNHRELLAEYLEVIASETLKVSTTPEMNLAVADKANALRKDFEFAVIPALAKAAAEPVAKPAQPQGEQTELGRAAATGWKIFNRTIAVVGALLFVALALAIAVSAETLAFKVAGVTFLLVMSAVLVLTFFYPGWQTRFATSNSQAVLERRLRTDLERRYRLMDEDLKRSGGRPGGAPTAPPASPSGRPPAT